MYERGLFTCGAKVSSTPLMVPVWPSLRYFLWGAWQCFVFVLRHAAGVRDPRDGFFGLGTPCGIFDRGFQFSGPGDGSCRTCGECFTGGRVTAADKLKYPIFGTGDPIWTINDRM